MRRTILSLLIAVSMMTGCAAGPPQTPAPRLIPPAHLTTADDPPPPPADSSMQALFDNHLEAMAAYWKLRERYQGLVEWLRQTGSLPSD